MVFPLYDDNSDRTTVPVVNYAIIAVNILVFVVLQGLGSNERFTYAFSTVPLEIITGHDVVTSSRIVEVMGQSVRMPGLQPTPVSVYLTLFTSMFMHGGIAHIAGNMLFLWIFGDNVEDRIGHLRYAVFYLLCGVLASLAHVFATAMFADPSSQLIPSLGASGAISGVLGGYLLLYPTRRVTVILFRFLTDVPAYVAIGIWFAFQLVNGLGMLGGGSQQGGGVAYAAHIGGFAAGLLLIKVFTIDRTTGFAR